MEDLQRLVRVERRHDLGQRAEVAVDELAEAARVVERARARAARDEELEAGRAERVLHVDDDERDPEAVVRRGRIACSSPARRPRSGPRSRRARPRRRGRVPVRGQRKHPSSLGTCSAARREDRAARVRALVPARGRPAAARAAASRGRERVAEIGTGTGVGAAWIVSALPPQTPFFTTELDRARGRRELFAADENVHVLEGDWRELLPPEAPFDLVFYDAAKQLRPREDGELVPACSRRAGSRCSTTSRRASPGPTRCASSGSAVRPGRDGGLDDAGTAAILAVRR